MDQLPSNVYTHQPFYRIHLAGTGLDPRFWAVLIPGYFQQRVENIPQRFW